MSFLWGLSEVESSAYLIILTGGSRDSKAKWPKGSMKIGEWWVGYLWKCERLENNLYSKKQHDETVEALWYETITSVTFLIDTIAKKATEARSMLSFWGSTEVESSVYLIILTKRSRDSRAKSPKGSVKIGEWWVGYLGKCERLVNDLYSKKQHDERVEGALIWDHSICNLFDL